MFNSKIRLQEFGGRGTGVLAAVAIAQGENVLTFHGSSVRSRGAHTLQIDADAHLEVDPPGRFVNHSCDPNCGVREGLTLVALRDIAAGEEVTFDYAMTEAEMEPMSCLCGSEKCRGTIAGYRALTPAQRGRYNEWISDYLRNV